VLKNTNAYMCEGGAVLVCCMYSSKWWTCATDVICPTLTHALALPSLLAFLPSTTAITEVRQVALG
jgi:hypothetical protein